MYSKEESFLKILIGILQEVVYGQVNWEMCKDFQT